jgi:hypothetical protein
LWLLAVGCQGDDGDTSDDTDTTDGTDDPPIATGFEDTLTEHGGCSDLLVFARDPADETMLSVTFDHPLTGAAAEDATIEFDLPSEIVAVEVVEGSRVSDLTCDAEIDGLGSVVVERWRGGAGHIVLVVDHDESNPDARPTADVTISDVRLRPTDASSELPLDAFSWSDIEVGWDP